MFAKRPSPIAMIGKVDVRQFVSFTYGEHTPSCSCEESLWKSPVHVEMSPSVAYLPEKHVESSGRYPVGIPGSRQGFEELRSRPTIFHGIDVQTKLIQHILQFRFSLQPAREICRQRIEMSETVALAAEEHRGNQPPIRKQPTSGRSVNEPRQRRQPVFQWRHDVARP